MVVEICVWLFGKPEWEIDTENCTAKQIEDLGKELKERLKAAAKLMNVLEKAGWDRSGGLYDILFFKDISKKQARQELKKLDISSKEVNLIEFGDEE